MTSYGPAGGHSIYVYKSSITAKLFIHSSANQNSTCQIKIVLAAFFPPSPTSTNVSIRTFV